MSNDTCVKIFHPVESFRHSVRIPVLGIVSVTVVPPGSTPPDSVRSPWSCGCR
jgi:hypothetical protein